MQLFMAYVQKTISELANRDASQLEQISGEWSEQLQSIKTEIDIWRIESRDHKGQTAQELNSTQKNTINQYHAYLNAIHKILNQWTDITQLKKDDMNKARELFFMLFAFLAFKYNLLAKIK